MRKFFLSISFLIHWCTGEVSRLECGLDLYFQRTCGPASTQCFDYRFGEEASVAKKIAPLGEIPRHVSRNLWLY